MAGISCQIERDTEDQISKVKAPNGKDSLLYKNALDTFGDPEEALNVWATAYTDSFKDSTITSNLTHLKSTKKGFKMIRNDGSQIHYKRAGKTVNLDLLLTSPELRGKGYANRIMNDFTTWADENGYTIKAVVSPRDRTTSADTIININLSHGFQFDSVNGIKSDFEMVRYPNLKNKVYDSNGEPLLRHVIKYIEQTTDVGELTDQDKLDVGNMMIRANINKASDFSTELNKIFPDGVFSASELRKSELFSDFDKNNILNNTEYKDNLTDLYKKLNNTENDFVVPNTESTDFHVLSGEVSKYGTSILLNPYAVQKEIADVVAGVKNRSDFDDLFNTIQYEGIKDRYNSDTEFADNMYNIFSNVDKVPVKHINQNGELTSDYKSNRSTATENTANLSDTDFTSDIDILTSLTESEWDSSTEDITKALKSIEKKGIKASIDLEGLSDYSGDRGPIIRFLDSLRTVENSPTDENFAHFLDEYDQFFDVNNEPKTRITESFKEPSQHINEPSTEYDMYNKYNLVKIDKDRYIKVDDRSIPELEAQLGEDQTQYIEDNLNKISTPEGEYDHDTVVKILLNKKIKDIPVENKATPPSDNTIKGIKQFDGNGDYLSTDYLTDFHRTYLEEKAKNSDKYKSVYSLFKIGDRGIELENNDPITLSNLKTQMSLHLNEGEINDLRNYSVISKDDGLKSLFEVEDDNPIATTRQDVRNYYANNIEDLPLYEGNYQKIKDGVVTNTATGDFLRINNNLYEISQSVGGQVFYRQVPTYKNPFNIIDTGKVNKFSDSEIKQYLRIELTKKSNNNLYSQKELSDINEESFDCVA